ncbi:MAG: BamA/TamA family outer membrane protein [Cyanobacteria bacterium P01_G01_bin.19]
MTSRYLVLPLLATAFFTYVNSAKAHDRNPKHQPQLQNFLSSKQYRLAAETHLSDSQKSNGGIWKIFQSLPIREITVPASQGQTIAEIQVRFVDRMGKPTEGRTKTEIILQEFELKPGDRYDSELAESGLIGVNNLLAVRQASLSLRPLSDNSTADSSLMVVTVEESSVFFFRFGGTFDPPTVLQGPARPAIVKPISNKASGFAPRFRLGVNNWSGNNQALTLGIEGGANNLGFDLDYRKFIRHDRGYAINIFNRRGVESEFDNGENDIDLADGSDPWVHRLGGGVEYFHPWAEKFIGALGMSYQVVSVRDAVISDELNSTDALGNTLTASDDGRDELLTLNYGLNFDRRNRNRNASRGFRTLFETDQSIPVGDSSLFYNRLSINHTHYIPLPLFGFTEGDRTLILDVQAGTILGDAIGYEAFSLGGSEAVRGYGRGELGTGRSFAIATAEYRFPMFAFRALQGNFEVGGTLFFDYGTDLGSADAVIGQPAVVRDKPGNGFGYGLGLRSLTPVGTVKLEFALNDEGDSEIIFQIGDRF